MGWPFRWSSPSCALAWDTILQEPTRGVSTWHLNIMEHSIIERERAVRGEFGPGILKCPYGVARFTGFRYGTCGYANYFMAYALHTVWTTRRSAR